MKTEIVTEKKEDYTEEKGEGNTLEKITST